MNRLLVPLLFAAAVASGGLFFTRFEVRGLDDLQVVPRDERRDAGWRTDARDLGAARTDRTRLDGGLAPIAGGPVGGELRGGQRAGGQTIRIASYNIQAFGTSKLEKRSVMAILADVVRRFDLVAIQEVRAKTQDVLPRFVQEINARGAHYDFIIGPRLGRTSSTEQYAYIYNTATIEADREAVYTVNDPDDLLHREPLVAAFRTREAPRDQAFTFTLVNVHTDPDEVKTEINVLDDVYFAVRNDGRREDDVILLGDFNADDRKLGELGRVPDLASLLPRMATNTRGTAQYDHLFASTRATQEFTGASGVVDVVREFNLSMEQSLEVSDHLPVWAEFSIYEAVQGNSVASRRSGAPR